MTNVYIPETGEIWDYVNCDLDFMVTLTRENGDVMGIHISKVVFMEEADDRNEAPSTC